MAKKNTLAQKRASRTLRPYERRRSFKQRDPLHIEDVTDMVTVPDMNDAVERMLRDGFVVLDASDVLDAVALANGETTWAFFGVTARDLSPMLTGTKMSFEPDGTVNTPPVSAFQRIVQTTIWSTLTSPLLDALKNKVSDLADHKKQCLVDRLAVVRMKDSVDRSTQLHRDRVGGAVTGEYESHGADVMISGFVNLGRNETEFLCDPGSYTLGSIGFGQVIDPKTALRVVPVRPLSVVFHFATLLHAHHAWESLTDHLRLNLAARLTRASSSLVNYDTMFEYGASPRLPTGKEIPLLSKQVVAQGRIKTAVAMQHVTGSVALVMARTLPVREDMERPCPTDVHAYLGTRILGWDMLSDDEQNIVVGYVKLGWSQGPSHPSRAWPSHTMIGFPFQPFSEKERSIYTPH